MNLNKIVRIDLNGNTDEIIVFPNELQRKLESIGRTDALIKVNSLISDKLPDEEKAAMHRRAFPDKQGANSPRLPRLALRSVLPPRVPSNVPSPLPTPWLLL